MSEQPVKTNAIVKHEETILGRTELAWSLHNQVKLGVFVTAQAIRQIRDDKLYEQLGYESFKQYIDEMAPISRSQAYVCCKIAERFTPLLADPKNNDLSCPDGGHEQKIDIASELDNLGWTKLKAISSLDEDDFKDIMEGDSLKMSNGNEMTLLDIYGMHSSNVEKEMKEYRKDKAKLQEDLKKSKSECKIQKQTIDDLEQKQEETRLSKLLYGKLITDVDDKQKGLSEVRERMMEIECIMGRINITMDDPQSLIKDFSDSLDRIRWGYKKMVNSSLWVATCLEEYMTESAFKPRIGQVDETPTQKRIMDAIHARKHADQQKQEQDIKKAMAEQEKSKKAKSK